MNSGTFAAMHAAFTASLNFSTEKLPRSRSRFAASSISAETPVRRT
ncbi:hypothetical protein [Corallococcus sp. AB049A]|nr:hypothetical protein [Corallococcus sp. AB049A]